MAYWADGVAASPAAKAAKPAPPAVHLPPLGESAGHQQQEQHAPFQLPPSSSARSTWGDSPVGGGWGRAWMEGDENGAPPPAVGPSKAADPGPRHRRPAAAPAAPSPQPSTSSSIPDGRECWTFSCSGWLFVYTFGVVKCLKELGLHKSVYAIGTSGGACAASYLFFGNDGDGDAANDTADVDRTVAYISECAVYARSHWRHPFRILACLEGAMDRFQPGGGCGGSGAGPAPSSSSSPPAPPSAAAGLGPAAAAALAGNLEVSVTTLPFLRNARVRDFGGPAGLRAAMLASACAIPVTPVWVPSLGAWCVDGAVSDIRLLKGMLLGRRFTSLHQVEGAVSVSPFYAARADITPSAFVPPWWGAYPPAPADLRWLFELGRRDALAWLDGKGRLPAGAVAAASGDDADHPPGPDAPTWRALLWEVRHLEAARAARAARLGRAARGRGPTPSSSSPATRRLPALARRLAWALIAGELFLSLVACALAVLVGPVLRDGVTTAAAARRWSAAVRGVAGLAVVALAGRRAGAGQAGPPVDATLREHSAVWRWLRFCL